ncbi:MAG TPA: quinoprotein dehydrogenase-associated putative ABC transporter substrate-binding protein [Bryobacteraceae bacterium]|nr:quinoprotein dehydrogenase-associated putative ABC transporter substrate-binding protein [Bryobacteraceae bacterium]
MSLVYKTALGIMFCVLAAGSTPLRVCADSNNLPFSNFRQQGFEDRLVRMAAQDLKRPLAYVWIAQRGRELNVLQGGACDVIAGIASSVKGVAVTRPYYRSSYVFVTRRGRPIIRSFDDPRLKTARIGLQVIGADDAAVPPERALADRGLVRNIAWFRLQHSFIREQAPILLDAVERGNVDVAIAWGPLAGYYARRDHAPVEISPVSPQSERSVPFVFDISMGVRPSDSRLLAQLNSFLLRRKAEIRHLLEGYGVPLVGRPAALSR